MTSANSPKRPRARRFRVAVIVIALLVLIGAVFAAYNARTLAGMASIGTAYGARVGCSCHLVAGRDLESCATDFEPGMELVRLSADGARVTASIPLVASRTAEYREGWGCQLLPED